MNEEYESWWDVREHAYRLLKEASELLAGAPLSSEELDEMTASIKSCNETIKIANKHLGLDS